MTLNQSPWARCLRHLWVAVTAITLTLLLAGPATAVPSDNRASAATKNEYLVVSDPQAEALHVYRAKDNKRTGSLDDIAVSSHGGTMPLPDGRLIVVDDANARVAAIKINAKGKPRIVDSVDIPGHDWDGMAWGATDRKLRYFAFSGEGHDGESVISVVDLTTFAIHQVEVQGAPDASGNVPETQVYLAGQPLQLVYTTGGQFHAMPLADVLADRTPQVTSTAAVGQGTHGPVVARNGGAVFSTTGEGFFGASITGTTLRSPRNVAYSATRTIPANYRPRLAADERTVWGAVAEDTGLAAADWADTRNHVNLIDTVTFKSRLVRLPDGQNSRLAISEAYAGVSSVHPDGDVLSLLDADRDSKTYGRIVGTVAISSSSDGPVAGQPTSGTQPHFVAFDPAGRRAYVTNGGDGKISVIDTASRRVVKVIDTPTPLNGGGYLVVVKPGAPVHDLISR
ncbi:MAG: hypothetical protein QM650_13085 [Microlunatus sp.]